MPSCLQPRRAHATAPCALGCVARPADRERAQIVYMRGDHVLQLGTCQRLVRARDPDVVFEQRERARGGILRRRRISHGSSGIVLSASVAIVASVLVFVAPVQEPQCCSRYSHRSGRSLARSRHGDPPHQSRKAPEGDAMPDSTTLENEFLIVRMTTSGGRDPSSRVVAAARHCAANEPRSASRS
jgi:hypothetical protein